MHRRKFVMLAATAGVGSALIGAPAGARTTGISWPADQALPRFAAPTRLTTSDVGGLDAATQLLAISVQGIVNRTTPRIYLLSNPGEGKMTWLNDLGVPFDAPVEPLSLVSRFRSELRGAVIYDPALPATINIATTIAGLDDGVVTSAAQASALGLPVLTDLTGRFSDELSANTWAIDNLWPRTSQRMVISLNPTIAAGLRDYAIANRAFSTWLDHSDPAQRALIERLADDMPTNSPYIGWLRGGESTTVETLSKRSVYVIAADTSQNLTVLGGVSAPINSRPRVITPPPLENKIYVTLTYSDGDNLQYAQHKMRMLWDDPARGSIPINWPIPPEILDAAPPILSYYQRSSTASDYLLSGPSGLGYVFPISWPDATFSTYVERTTRYAQRAGMNSTAILNRISSPSNPTPQYVAIPEARVKTYADILRPVGLFQNWSNWVTDDLVVAGLPIARSRMALSPTELRTGLNNALSVYEAKGGNSPVFTMIFLHAWTMTPSDAAAVVSELDTRFAVLRGDEYLALQRVAHGLRPVLR